MNKLLILVLAVCLVSVHAFVKRDAPETAQNNENYLDNVQDKLKEFGTGLQKAFNELVDPDKVKEYFDKTLTGVNDALTNMNKKEEPKA